MMNVCSKRWKPLDTHICSKCLLHSVFPEISKKSTMVLIRHVPVKCQGREFFNSRLSVLASYGVQRRLFNFANENTGCFPVLERMGTKLNNWKWNILRIHWTFFYQIYLDYPCILSRAETFAGRTFRDFRDFGPFSREFLPGKKLSKKFAKVISAKKKLFPNVAKVFSKF